ncbi:hypothetical protein [Actinosynnema sp. NPDC020468]|uniref:hypothetical protein n=1 Tax=Actinosynnema sp. NPDC020468 TaxID=3154488 RepID=UPI0033E385AB
MRRVANPDRERIEAAVLSLARGGHLVLSVDEDRYVQVWLREDGLYQLEHRAGSPGEHYRTLTVSAEKVYTAFGGWSRGEDGWDAPFTWQSIGAWFTAEGDQGAGTSV